jgi:hypothetical protein
MVLRIIYLDIIVGNMKTIFMCYTSTIESEPKSVISYIKSVWRYIKLFFIFYFINLR